MTEISREEIERGMKVLAIKRAIDARKARTPFEWYQPSPKQLRFHKSMADIRGLFPGNRFGKTSAAAMEAQWFATRTHPYRVLPEEPGDVIWGCQSIAQFKILLEEVRLLIWGTIPKWNDSDKALVFPNGGRIWAWPRERDWDSIKGVNPALIVFDEDATAKLWNESKARTFGRQRTPRIITNTPTEAMGTWMETEIYQPWFRHHKELGLSEREANEQQLHPEIFCITIGGIEDNPSQTADDVKRFRAQVWTGGEDEWHVRNYGGFRYIGVQGVFDADGLKHLLAMVRAGGSGRRGGLVITEAADATDGITPGRSQGPEIHDQRGG